jgi:FkbM family methyltransferase
MTIVSYAQNFEDVILWRALKQVKGGFYIDIGAQDPVVDSVSLAFYEQGWRGVHVEPIAHYAERLRTARPDEQVVEAAIGGQEGTIPFYEISNTGLSTGDKAIALAHERDGRIAKRIEVDCVPLSNILDAHKDRDIHWLKIDVEGMESQVIETWSPSPVRPWIVLVESTKPNSSEPTIADWEPELLALGYTFVYFDGLNRFYLSQGHPELRSSFCTGPNVFDAFVLSGRATAPFCGKLLGDIADKGQQLSDREEEVARLAKSLESTRAEALAERAALARAAQAWDNASAALSGEIARKTEAIASHDSAIADLNTQLIEREDERTAQARKTQQLSAALDAARKEATQINQRLSEAQTVHEAEIVHLNRCIAEMKIQGQVAATHEAALKQQISALRERLNAIYHSTSWRVTLPLRAAGNLLSGGYRALAAAPPLSTAQPNRGKVGKNVVVFTTYPLLVPRHGGQVRCAQIVKALRSSGLEVITISVVDIGAYSTDPLGEYDIWFPADSPFRLFHGEHFPYASDYLSGQYAAGDEKAYQRILAAVPQKVDIALLEQPWMLPVVQRLRLDRNIGLVVYDAHNDEASLKGAILRETSEPALNLLEAIKKLEIAACSEASLIFAVSEADRAILSNHCDKKILLAPNGVDPGQASAEDYAKWKETLDADISRFGLYVASAHPPNFNSFFDVFNNALGFLSPDEAICVAGGACGPLAEMLGGQRYEALNRSRLRFLGHLSNADLAAIKRLAHVFVLPIVEGSGSNLKTAEALFSEAGVVGTGVSFRGYEKFTTLPNVILANPGREFQAAVKYAMEHPKPVLNKETRQSLREITWAHTLRPIVEAIASEREECRQIEGMFCKSAHGVAQ